MDEAGEIIALLERRSAGDQSALTAITPLVHAPAMSRNPDDALPLPQADELVALDDALTR